MLGWGGEIRGLEVLDPLRIPHSLAACRAFTLPLSPLLHPSMAPQGPQDEVPTAQPRSTVCCMTPVHLQQDETDSDRGSES